MSFSWKGKRCLITGADGFVASNIAKALVESGAFVVGVVQNKKKAFSSLETFGIAEKIDLVYGDIADYDFVQRIFNSYEIDTCFHLAAAATVSHAVNSPVATFKSNITGTWNVLESARLCTSTRSIVVASSDKAYGESRELPYREEHALRGIRIYDASKACADLLSQAYFFNYKLPVIVTRCSNIYGPGDRNFSRVVPRSIIRIRKGLKPIVHEGSKDHLREYLYVDDAVEAYLRLAEHAYTKKFEHQLSSEEAYSYCAYNIGGGEKNVIKTEELIKKILKLMGKEDIGYEIKEKKDKVFLEISQQYLSNDKFYRELGWSPKIYLDEGLKRTIKWYEDNLSSEDVERLIRE